MVIAYHKVVHFAKSTNTRKNNARYIEVSLCLIIFQNVGFDFFYEKLEGMVSLEFHKEENSKAEHLCNE